MDTQLILSGYLVDTRLILSWLFSVDCSQLILLSWFFSVDSSKLIILSWFFSVDSSRLILLSWYSVDSQLILSWNWVDTELILSWYWVDIQLILKLILSWFSVDTGWYSVDSHLILRWYSVDTQLILSWIFSWLFSWNSVDSQLILSWYSADAQLILSWYSFDSQVILSKGIPHWKTLEWVQHSYWSTGQSKTTTQHICHIINPTGIGSSPLMKEKGCMPGETKPLLIYTTKSCTHITSLPPQTVQTSAMTQAKGKCSKFDNIVEVLSHRQ